VKNISKSLFFFQGMTASDYAQENNHKSVEHLLKNYEADFDMILGKNLFIK